MTDRVAMPGPGQVAPEFSLPSSPEQMMSLAQLRGSPVILAFYPADWSPVCSDQMVLYEAIRPEFTTFGAHLLGISVDGVWCHRAFAERNGIRYPLLADFEPKGAVARRYGVYEPECGTADRALFVVDGDGVIAWSYLSPPSVNPGADGILSALERLAPVRQVPA
ncbi:MAG: redoxin domain-containing protein [Micromonosporaceae bacterium]|nr:redoxin domain-containing protein [Micromonosporaceae bacterium]